MNVLVAGGGTIAPIDDVRFIANASTGRFSASISEACLEAGATVWHVHAPGAELPLLRRARLDRELAAGASSADLGRLLDEAANAWRAHSPRLRLVPAGEGTVSDYAAALRAALTARPIDVAFLAMAVSDYEPDRAEGKLSSDLDELSLRLRPTPKVIRSVKEWAPKTFLVGFKLLSGVPEETLLAAAASSGVSSGADLVVANDLALYRATGHVFHVVRPPDPAPIATFGPSARAARDLVELVLGLAGSR
jgi:phosphopantothenate-cysteine ligase